MKRFSITAMTALIALTGLIWQPALAVKPKTLTLEDRASLEKGRCENVAITSRGELLLAPAVKRFEIDPKQADTANAIAQGPDGAIYIGTGPNGIVFRLADGKLSQFFKAEEGQVFSLLFSKDGALLVGTGGQKAKLYKVDKGGKKASVLWQPEDVKYIWAMVRDSKGCIYAATGTDGAIYKLSPDGKKVTKIASVKVRNILTLAFAGPGKLVFGTDGEGLIGCVDIETGHLQILYDADEPTISAVASDSDGNVYAITARATKRVPVMASRRAESKPAGRPDPKSAGKPAQPSEKGPVAILVASAGKAVGTKVKAPQRQPAQPNAVYRIRPDGFVTEIARLPGMLLSLAIDGNKLLVGTGSPGRIYILEPEKEIWQTVFRADEAYFPAALRDWKGRLWLATAKPAGAVQISRTYAEAGSFQSEPFDAKQPAKWGRISVDLQLPRGTKATLQTRSSNLSDKDLPGWSQWSEPIDLAVSSEAQIPSPPGRFLQVKVNLSADRAGTRTPLISRIRLTYVHENFPPEISSLTVSAADEGKRRSFGPPSPEAKQPPKNNGRVTIKWQASDPNGDKLLYDLYIRRFGENRWIRIAKDLKQPQYKWNSRTVPDGNYEVRLIARDDPDNPPGTSLARARISDPFVVDNTPPRIEALRWQAVKGNTFRIRARLTDSLSPISAFAYATDSAEKWVPVLPTDDIFDSRTEHVDFEVGPLEPGQHIIALKVVDSRGNEAYRWVNLTVGE